MNPLSMQHHPVRPLPQIHPGPGGLALRKLQSQIQLSIEHAQRYSAKFEEQLRSQVNVSETQVSALEIKLEALHTTIRSEHKDDTRLNEILDSLDYLRASRGHLEAENKQLKEEKYEVELELEKKRLEIHELEAGFHRRLSSLRQEQMAKQPGQAESDERDESSEPVNLALDYTSDE
ncbi:hypothetical protein C8J56DRAFT_1042965 [Mycena floridula]|nr:hypothetical protein C8J56DRAFT_1042965 [Mycena floridula]